MIGIIIGTSHNSDLYILFEDNVALIYEKIVYFDDLILTLQAACHHFLQSFFLSYCKP